jgi:hypothetical protein
MKKWIIIGMVFLLFTGCGQTGESKKGNAGSPADTKANNEASQDAGSQKSSSEGFSYEYNGVKIPMNVDAAPIIEKLGKPANYFEAASCAFQGLDKVYTYSNFEIGTYPKGDKDFISTVTFLDDTVETDQGICVGSTLDEVKDAYGKDFTNKGTSYEYRKGDTKLTFIIEDDSVAQITYGAVVEGLEN